ncbi:MAG: hypothetical protein SFV52_02980 [Saprospiraceae bacterium]|nr:hypothetical protein [Saprospiraceae bacterium]
MSSASQIKHLNQHQLEILKLFTRELDDNDLIEIKRLIVKYLAGKVTKMADDIWDKNNWTDEDMERLLKTHKRTPYNPNN